MFLLLCAAPSAATILSPPVVFHGDPVEQALVEGKTFSLPFRVLVRDDAVLESLRVDAGRVDDAARILPDRVMARAADALAAPAGYREERRVLTGVLEPGVDCAVLEAVADGQVVQEVVHLREIGRLHGADITGPGSFVSVEPGRDTIAKARTSRLPGGRPIVHFSQDAWDASSATQSDSPNLDLWRELMRIAQTTRRPTDFQQSIDENALQRALEQHLPGHTLRQVVELDAGLFNNAYRVDTDAASFVLKVAPHAAVPVFFVERHLMAREQHLAPRLRAAHPLVPEYGDFFDIADRPAFLQRLVPGRLWHAVESDLNAEENALLWRQLGDFARTLHTETGDRFGYPDPFVHAAKWSRFIELNVEGLAEDCRRHDALHPEVEDFLALFPRFGRRLDEVTTPRLLHGDLWPRNVLIDGEGPDIHIVAVVDGERAFWGDPLADWVLILYDVPEAFWVGYGENLAKGGDPVRIDVYKGMNFMLNILEAKRFEESDAGPRERLGAVNRRLRSASA